MNKSYVTTLFCLVLALSFSAGALAEPIATADEFSVGPEWEFTRPSLWHGFLNPADIYRAIKYSYIRPGKGESQAIAEMREALLKRCLPDCHDEEFEGKYTIKNYRIHFASGYWVQLTADAWVVEVIAKPAKLSELYVYEADMQSVFAAASDVGLKTDSLPVSWMPQAGHFNMSVHEAFHDSAHELIGFASDFSNHPELSLGILGKDLFNAPPLAALSADQRETFDLLVSQTNMRAQNGEHEKANEVAPFIIDRVYTNSPYMTPGAKYQALGLLRVPYQTSYKDEPAEIRSVRMQATPNEFILFTELMTKRAAFLRRTQRPGEIAFVNLRRVDFTKQQLVSRWRIYLREMNEDPKRYESLVAPNLRDIEPDAFVSDTGSWSDKAYAKAMMSHIELLPSSNWLQEKFISALSDPQAKTSGRGSKVVDAWARYYLHYPPNDFVKAKVLAMADRLKELGWLKHSKNLALITDVNLNYERPKIKLPRRSSSEVITDIILPLIKRKMPERIVQTLRPGRCENVLKTPQSH